MASRTLETRFERMTVQDENDHGEGTRLYAKGKVSKQPADAGASMTKTSRDR